MMKTKALGAAIAAALMGLSAAAFAQTTPGTRGPSGGTIGQDNPAANETPATGTATGAANGSASVGTSGTGTYGACDNLTGAEKDRCLRDNSSRGASSGAYIPQRPSQSMDRQDPIHPNVKSADQERSRGQ